MWVDGNYMQWRWHSQGAIFVFTLSWPFSHNLKVCIIVDIFFAYLFCGVLPNIKKSSVQSFSLCSSVYFTGIVNLKSPALYLCLPPIPHWCAGQFNAWFALFNIIQPGLLPYLTPGFIALDSRWTGLTVKKQRRKDGSKVKIVNCKLYPLSLLCLCVSVCLCECHHCITFCFNLEKLNMMQSRIVYVK